MSSPTDNRLCRSFDYEAVVESVAAARRDSTQFLFEQFRSLRTASDNAVGWLVERLAVVVSELCCNAVEAAPGRWFRVDIIIDPDPAANAGPARDDEGDVGRRPLTVRCSVTDPAANVELGTLPFGAPPDPAARRGRGLLIVDGLSDRCRVERISDTLVVTAELSL